MVDEVSNVGSIEGSDVFQLATISFIPFDVIKKINKIDNKKYYYIYTKN